MSRTYADYSPQERGMLANQSASFQKQRIDNLELQSEVQTELLKLLLSEVGKKTANSETIIKKYDKLLEKISKDLNHDFFTDKLGRLFEKEGR